MLCTNLTNEERKKSLLNANSSDGLRRLETIQVFHVWIILRRVDQVQVNLERVHLIDRQHFHKLNFKRAYNLKI